MKRIFLSVILILIATYCTQAQNKVAKDSTKTFTKPTVKSSSKKKDWSKVNLEKRPSDHFIFQYGIDGWAGRPDSIRTKGFSRHFNFYAMIDKPMKKNPHFSVAYGAGIGTSNIFFDKEIVNLAGTGSTLPFTDGTNSNHFNKFKLTSIFLEIPLELRIYENPENKNSGWKGSIGVKLGTLLKSYTKGKDYQNASGGSVYGKTYIEKVSNKRFLNTTKLAVSGRVGYGIFSLHGDYNILGVIKDGFGPTINAYSVGISIGGL
jgi:hypothetical protein